MDVVAGSTDVTTYFVLRTESTGAKATGLTITDLDLQYTRSGSAPSTKVDATALAAADSAHADNKAIEVDATDQPGLLRVDWPDAAFASGAREVILTVKWATGSEDLRVNLTPVPANVTQMDGSTNPASIIENAVWNAVRADHNTINTMGRVMNTLNTNVDAAISAILTTALTESYNTDGAAPTAAQALFVIMQMLTEMSISGTTMTVKKLDGSTTALTLTLNSSTEPTSVTRAT